MTRKVLGEASSGAEGRAEERPHHGGRATLHPAWERGTHSMSCSGPCGVLQCAGLHSQGHCSLRRGRRDASGPPPSSLQGTVCNTWPSPPGGEELCPCLSAGVAGGLLTDFQRGPPCTPSCHSQLFLCHFQLAATPPSAPMWSPGPCTVQRSPGFVGASSGIPGRLTDKVILRQVAQRARVRVPLVVRWEQDSTGRSVGLLQAAWGTGPRTGVGPRAPPEPLPAWSPIVGHHGF